MNTQRDSDGWLRRCPLIVLTLAVLSVLLFLTDILPAGMFAFLAFVLATVWVGDWLYGSYRADREERAQFASSHRRAQGQR